MPEPTPLPGGSEDIQRVAERYGVSPHDIAREMQNNPGLSAEQAAQAIRSRVLSSPTGTQQSRPPQPPEMPPGGTAPATGTTPPDPNTGTPAPLSSLAPRLSEQLEQSMARSKDELVRKAQLDNTPLADALRARPEDAGALEALAAQGVQVRIANLRATGEFYRVQYDRNGQPTVVELDASLVTGRTGTRNAPDPRYVVPGSPGALPFGADTPAEAVRRSADATVGRLVDELRFPGYLSNYPASGAASNANLRAHLEADGTSRGEVYGTHNRAEFFRLLQQQADAAGVPVNDLYRDVTPAGSPPGVNEYQYRLPVTNSRGQFEIDPATGAVRLSPWAQNPKTTFDPAVLPKDVVDGLVEQASRAAFSELGSQIDGFLSGSRTDPPARQIDVTVQHNGRDYNLRAYFGAGNDPYVLTNIHPIAP